MFHRVTVAASDLEASRRFYETVLAAFARDPWAGFAVEEGRPTRGLHVAFAAASREEVDAFWRVGVAAGHPSDGEPGLRRQYRPDYYGAFLLDPDGNSVEAVHRPGRTETGPAIDHLWLGVSDLEASRRFWEGVAPSLGLQVEEARFEGMVAIAANGRHLMLVADGRPPTTGVRIEVAAEAPLAAVTDPDGNVAEAP
jgi:catechol 2,3-dioxygenase-like lactoylglutathione lyase family enzyme